MSSPVPNNRIAQEDVNDVEVPSTLPVDAALPRGDADGAGTDRSINSMHGE